MKSEKSTSSQEGQSNPTTAVSRQGIYLTTNPGQENNGNKGEAHDYCSNIPETYLGNEESNGPTTEHEVTLYHGSDSMSLHTEDDQEQPDQNDGPAYENTRQNVYSQLSDYENTTNLYTGLQARPHNMD